MPFRNPIGALSDLIADTITGAVITGGEIIGTTITGALIRTAAAGQRLELGAIRNRLYGYSGDSQETNPGYLEIDVLISGVLGVLNLISPSMGGGNQAQLALNSNKNTGQSTAQIVADTFQYNPGVGGGTFDLTGNTLDLSGDSIRRIRFGSDVVTIGSTVSTATKSVAHGQGVVPDLVICTAANGVIGYYANVDTYNTTNISLRASQRDGTVGAASVTVNWLAIWA